MKKSKFYKPLAVLGLLATFGLASCGGPAPSGPDVPVEVDVKVTGIQVTLGKASLKVGEETTVAVTVSPDNATNKGYDIAIESNGVASLTNGKIKALKVGTAKITATAKDGSGVKGEATLTVTEAKVTGITVSLAKSTINVDEETDVTVTVVPEVAANREYDLSIENNGVASLTNGKIKALKVGTAKITATAKDGSGVKGEATLTVVETRATVTFKNGEEEFSTVKAAVGTVPAVPEDLGVPRKAVDENGAYIFRGWIAKDATEIKPVAAIQEGETNVEYTAAFDTVKYAIYGMELKGGEALSLEVVGEVSKGIANPQFKVGFKHNDNVDHHGWDGVELGAADVTTVVDNGGQFKVTAKLTNEFITAFRHGSLMFRLGLSDETLKDESEPEVYHYDTKSGVYVGQPVSFKTDEVTLGNVTLNLFSNESSWNKVSMTVLNTDKKEVNAVSATLEIKDNVVYYVINGLNGGYTQAELEKASMDLQHNGNVDGAGWGYITEGELQGAGLPASSIVLGNNAGVDQEFKAYFPVSPLAEKFGAFNVFTVHYSLLELEGTGKRGDLKVPTLEFAPSIHDGFVYDILRNGDTWNIPALRVVKADQNAILSTTVEVDNDNNVYYVINGYAGSATEDSLLADTMSFVHNDNLDHAGWDTVLEGLVASRVTINESKFFKQYFKVNDQANLKPAADNAQFVFTSKVTVARDSNKLVELKFEIEEGYAPVQVEGYEYGIMQSGDTWSICSLYVKKLAA